MSTTLETVLLREDVSAGLDTRVDRQAGIVRGVHILGSRSRNNRRYLER